MKRRHSALCLVLLAAPLVVACGGSGGAPQDASAQAKARAVERLRGTWLLVEYRPEQQLEPMLHALLAAQVGSLRLTFDGARMIAQGVGVHAERAYVVRDAAGDDATIILSEPSGVEYEVVGSFMGDHILFQANTPPWRGQGRLARHAGSTSH